MQELALVSEILKEDYHGPLRKLLNDSAKFPAQLEKNRESFAGKYAVVPLHVGRNTGVGSRREKEVIPRAGAQKTKVIHIPVHTHYMAIGLTRQTIDQMATDRGSFVRAIKLEMDGGVADVTRDRSRQSWGDGTGKIATCDTTAASTTVVLAADTPEQVLVNLQEGMQIDIGAAGTPQSVASDREVLSVNFTTPSITISGAAVTTAPTDFIYRQGSGYDGEQREVTGVKALVDDSILFTVNPSTTPQYAAIVDEAASTRPANENFIETLVHRTENRSGHTIDQLWAEDGVYRFLVNLIKARQRIVNSVELKGGHSGVDFQFGAESMPLVRDRDAEPGALFGFNFSSFSHYVLEDWQWEDEMGSGEVLRLSPDRTHVYEGFYFSEDEYAVVNRNANFVARQLEVA